MGPAWTDAVRFVPGTRLRFEPALPPALRAALAQARPALREWLEALDEAAALTVLSTAPDRCTLRADAGAGTALRSLGDLAVATDAGGACHAQIRWTAASGPQVRDFDDVALMLGGEHDVYLARRSAAEVRHLARWHYEDDGSVVVSIYPAAFASRLPAAAAALLPAELRIGTLRPIGDAGGA